MTEHAKAPKHPKAGPVFVPDAGALFQKDRSGDPRKPGDTEGKVNFASMAVRAQETVDACRAEAALEASSATTGGA